jgi:hypothetical protein
MKPVKGGQGPVWAVAPLIIIINYCLKVICIHTEGMGKILTNILNLITVDKSVTTNVLGFRD